MIRWIFLAFALMIGHASAALSPETIQGTDLSGGYVIGPGTNTQTPLNNGGIANILSGTKPYLATPAGTCVNQCDLFLGPGAGVNIVANQFEYGSIGIGYNALGQALSPTVSGIAPESLCIGFIACGSLTAPYHMIGLGTGALADVLNGGANNVDFSLALGDDAMHFANASWDIAIGDSVLSNDTGKGNNTVIDAGAMKMGASQTSISGGFTVMGARTLEYTSTVTSAHNVIAIGDAIVMNPAGITTLNQDVFVGHGVANSAAGTEFSDTFVGDVAAGNLNGGHGDSIFGAERNGLTTGNNNTTVGAGIEAVSKVSITTGSQNTELGAGTAVPSPTASNQFAAVNFLYGLNMSGTGATVSPGTLGLGTTVPNAALTVGSAGGTADDGHLGFLGTAPALTSCGGGSPAMDATANDASGVITEGSSATGCVATFAIAYQTAPHCIVSSPSGNAFTSYTTSTTALTLVNASLSSAKYAYICTQ